MATHRNFQRIHRRIYNLQPSHQGIHRIVPKENTNHTNDVKPKWKRDSPEYMHELLLNLYECDKKSTTDKTLPNSDDNEGNSNYERTIQSLSDPVDIELYTLYGLLLKNFVFGWYKNKLNLCESQKFMSELIYILQGAQNSVQTLARKVDWSHVIFDDLFTILDIHLLALRRSKEVNGTRYSRNIDPSADEIESNFMAINGHFCMKSVESQDEYSKILSKFIIAEIIPEECLKSEISVTFLDNLLGDLVLGNLFKAMKENFVIWDLIGAICDAILRKEKPKTGSWDFSWEHIKATISDLITSTSHLIAYSTGVINSSTKGETHEPFTFSILQFLIDLLTIDERYPLIDSWATWLLSMVSNSEKCTHLVNNMAQNVLGRTLLTKDHIAGSIRFLRHLMFPEDSFFYMKPRFIPSNDKELYELKMKNEKKLKEVLITKIPYYIRSKLFGDHLDEAVDEFFNGFKYSEVNASLLWQLIDLLAGSLFPKMSQFKTSSDALKSEPSPSS